MMKADALQDGIAMVFKMKLVPQSIVYFSWADKDITTYQDGPFIDTLSLKEYLI